MIAQPSPEDVPAVHELRFQYAFGDIVGSGRIVGHPVLGASPGHVALYTAADTGQEPAVVIDERNGDIVVDA